MKNYIFTILILSTVLLKSQNLIKTQPNGGGEFMDERTVCLTQEDRIKIEALLESNIRELKQQHLIPFKSTEEVNTPLGWPLRKSPDLKYNSYYAINNYVDLNVNSGQTLDYNCGTRTYDGHLGIDIDTWPFPWLLTQNNAVEVVAAREGMIIAKTEGYEDNHCACMGTWNAIFIQHPDSSVAFYGHMKNNSITKKTIGQTVSQGEYLGVVASSGCSTQPHLHFEIYKSIPFTRNNLIEPFSGNCNNLNPESWWQVQKPYREPTLNALLTHKAVPIHGCPATQEAPNLSDTLASNTPIHFAAYYHDQSLNDITTYKIKQPDGTIWRTWEHTSNNTFTKSWWYWTFILPSNSPYGKWQWEATYKGRTYSHDFILTQVSTTLDYSWKDFKLSPNPTTEGVVFLENLPEGIINIRCLNSLGETVIFVKTTSQSYQLSMSSLPSGLYFLTMDNGSNMKSYKIFKL